MGKDVFIFPKPHEFQHSDILEEPKLEPFFYYIFEQLPRVGPGNYESTKRAFDIVRQTKPLPEVPAILDIGCGTGLHTVHLAELSGGRITALDRHRPFLDRLERHARKRGVSDRIECVIGDMGAMAFGKRSFDLIWAEGSMFIIGVETALKLWKTFLKPGAMIAFTDLFWFKPGMPDELKVFFEQVSPGMMNREEAMRVIEACGYRLVGDFQIPESAWWDDFYSPMERVLTDSRVTHSDKPDALAMIDYFQTEIDMFRKYSNYYGYIFFILENK